ncbi:UbiD family decarboxylase [Pseudorhodoplanes sinuspersici]|uniref:3-octaprenyl-4-hydroxybenzoate carboxy-lyase n=1 Tax=Pseudorhodoplanes sinuspersici TaxID=1235591 RepID=A0A1W6ZKR7_9HYPH|nr:UbiD family decarboxylase [Pseudorhodoplanes sinuspersici]ARP97845.1 3-octaprenyl-4-hydroxybenzoate carboxy-lyase [Pseudorhodoplanes sinuspersici]RKE68423.1 UbiD family decarboxylase [Pseudorhodoplanes sinuspersici]
MASQALRHFLTTLEADGQLHRVRRSVDPRFEIAAVLMERMKGDAQLFEAVEGHSIPVVGNVFNSRERLATALGAPRADLHRFILQALRRPIAPVMQEGPAPVQEVVHDGPLDLPSLLPAPTWFERESGPYITAGVIVAKDPETGRRNVSIARLRLDGGGRIMAGIAKNHHLNILADKAAAMGRALPIAVAIGNCAQVLLGSQMYLGLGDDEYDVAGGLLGEPLRLVKCRTVDLEVPADAEIILEGELRAEDRVPEGLVSEFHGFYVDYGPGTGGEIGCVTHRRNPVFQSILPAFTPEHCLLGAVAIEAVACDALQRIIPSVRRVLVTDGGMGRLHAIISMHRPRPGEGKRAILLAMGQVNLFKNVIVVDDDIDPEDPTAVEWSLAARFRGHEDLIVLPGVKADRCDPVHEDLLVTKIGMVAATRPGDGAANSRSEFALLPKGVMDRVRKTIADY